MRKLSASAALLLSLSAQSAFAWDGMVGGNRLACDFVADGIVRVQYALGDGLPDNGTGVVASDVTGGGDGGNLAFTVDPETGRIVFAEKSTGRVLLAEARTAPHVGTPVDTEKVVYDEKSARTEHTANGDIVASGLPPRVGLRTMWDADGVARFAYSTDGRDFTDLAGSFQLRWGNYRGDRVGLFAYSTKGDEGEAVFTSISH